MHSDQQCLKNKYIATLDLGVGRVSLGVCGYVCTSVYVHSSSSGAGGRGRNVE